MIKYGDTVTRKVSESGDVGRVVWIDSQYQTAIVKMIHLDNGDGHGAYTYKSGFPLSELISA